jgi:hypothetical protein
MHEVYRGSVIIMSIVTLLTQTRGASRFTTITSQSVVIYIRITNAGIVFCVNGRTEHRGKAAACPFIIDGFENTKT